MGKKGVVLMIILGVVLIVALLGGVILNIVLSQSRLTHHQISRIQAYYASQAALNYAIEKLRNGEWVAGTNCTGAPACTPTAVWPVGAAVNNFYLDTANDYFPASIQGMTLIITPAQYTVPANPCYFNDRKACISVTTTYTYTP
jgi:Tfp pilus assembly protein PilX